MEKRTYLTIKTKRLCDTSIFPTKKEITKTKQDCTNLKTQLHCPMFHGNSPQNHRAHSNYQFSFICKGNCEINISNLNIHLVDACGNRK